MPNVTRALIIANVVVFLLEGNNLIPFIDGLALWPPGSSGFGGPGFQPWQLVTYAFLHGGLAHLFFNMLGLYIFGSEVERLFGSRFYLQYWFGCVVSAAILHLVVTGVAATPPVPMVGASGGVFGLLLAFGVYFPERRVMLIFPPIPLPARIFVTLYGALELLLGVTQTQSGVAHFAHLGGMLGGWLMIQHRRGRFPFKPRR
jgi:membrane associated rhomboid family serine protease